MYLVILAKVGRRNILEPLSQAMVCCEEEGRRTRHRKCLHKSVLRAKSQGRGATYDTHEEGHIVDLKSLSLTPGEAESDDCDNCCDENPRIRDDDYE